MVNKYVFVTTQFSGFRYDLEREIKRKLMHKNKPENIDELGPQATISACSRESQKVLTLDAEGCGDEASVVKNSTSILLPT